MGRLSLEEWRSVCLAGWGFQGIPAGFGTGDKTMSRGGKFGGKDLYNHWQWGTGWGGKGRPQQVVCWRAGEKTGVLILEELRERWWSAIILLASPARVNINSILIHLEEITKSRWAKKNLFWAPLSIHLSISTYIYVYMSVSLSFSLCSYLFSLPIMPFVCSFFGGHSKVSGPGKLELKAICGRC